MNSVIVPRSALCIYSTMAKRCALTDTPNLYIGVVFPIPTLLDKYFVIEL